MQFGFVPAFASGLCNCQRFCQRRETCLWFPESAMDVSEEGEKIRSEYPCACATMGSQVLRYLLDPCLRPALLCQGPTSQDSTGYHPVWETLCLREDDGGFGTLLGGMRSAAQLMEHGSKVQDHT